MIYQNDQIFQNKNVFVAIFFKLKTIEQNAEYFVSTGELRFFEKYIMCVIWLLFVICGQVNFDKSLTSRPITNVFVNSGQFH